MTKLAVFDCDGTLIDGQASICRAMDEAFAETGLPAPDAHQVRRMVGLSLPQAMRRLVPDIDEDLQRNLVDAYKRAFRAQREAGELSQQLFEGIAEVLDALHGAGWQLAVATGMSRRGLDHCLASHSLTKHFVSLQTADDHPSKPDPAMLEAALFEAAAEPSEAVMIGDTAYDMQMARDAGVRAIGVDWGYHSPEELRAAGAEFVATSRQELKAYLLR
ncbi:HAD-IA family hydrolase [Novosphingobium sp. PS1R-30]|uniref:HAD-IA family hydrolase n=1 Tax=Novosphingobium anseongense TaxID=3133436 RepID=A0ABU8RQI8_9SPHN